MAHQFLLNIPQEGPSALIGLFRLGGRQMARKLAKIIKEGSADLVVCRASRPEVEWCSAGNAWDFPERRQTKLLVFCHKTDRPALQVLQKLVELSVHLMAVWDFPFSLFDVLHQVDDLTQHSVESSDSVGRWWRVGRRTGPLSPKTAGVLVNQAHAGLSAADRCC